MSDTLKFEVITLSRFNPSSKGRQNAYVYPGELYPPKMGLLPHQCLGVAVKFDMETPTEGQPRLIGEVFIRNDMNFLGKYPEVHSFLKENQENISILITKAGYFLMEKESAREMEGLNLM